MEVSSSKSVTLSLTSPTPSSTDMNADNPFLKALRVPTIHDALLKYLPKPSIYALRCTKFELWNNFAAHIMELHLNEDNKIKEEPRMSHFLFESELSLQNFTFENVKFIPDKPNEFIGNNPYFETFLTKYAENLKSLHLVKCYLKMATFFRLISKLDVLEELHLIECDPVDLFIAGFAIMDSVEYMEKTCKNLAKLKRFQFRDMPPKELNKIGGICLMIGSTFQLESLNLLLYGPLQFPNDVFKKILVTNKNTLKKLELHSFNLNEELLQLIWAVKLKKLTELTLNECSVDHAGRFASFLSLQDQLQLLRFSNMVLPEACFEGADNLINLKILNFYFCTIDEDALLPFCQLTQLRTCCFEGDEDSVTAMTKFVDKMNDTNLVDMLQLRNRSESAYNSLLVLSANFPRLKFLDIKFMKVKASELSNIWELDELQGLYMHGCTFEEGEEKDEGKESALSLSHLQELKFLDLSNTDYDDEDIKEDIVLLENLQELNLSYTHATFPGISTLVTTMPNLKLLDVRGCKLKEGEIENLKILIADGSNGLTLMYDEPPQKLPPQSDFSYIS